MKKIPEIVFYDPIADEIFTVIDTISGGSVIKCGDKKQHTYFSSHSYWDMRALCKTGKLIELGEV